MMTIIDENTVGLTIWRLPEGGFAVGRFFSARRGGGGGEREVPIVIRKWMVGFIRVGL